MRIYQNKAYLFAILSVLFWSTSATAFKITLRKISFQELLIVSTLVANIYLYLLLLMRRELSILFSYSGKQILYSALLGFLNPFLYYVVLFKAYSLLPAQMAQPLNFVWPLTTVIFSVIFLQQKLTKKSILGLIISFLGVVVISSQGHFNFSLSGKGNGIFLALFSSVIWGLFFILNVKDKRSAIHKLTLNFTFGFVYILIYNLINKTGFPLRTGLLGGIYIGLFEMGITFVFWLKALSFPDITAKVSNLIYLTPFVSLIFIFLVLREKILLSSIFGLILIVSGILIQNRR